MSTKFRAAVAVYGVLMQGDQLLLARRAGSGYRDGELGLPSGHLDGDESAVQGLIRELSEELAIDVRPESCELATVLHRRAEADDDEEYLDLFFQVDDWTGSPRIAEPDKCTELVWADPRHLPEDVVDYVADAMHAIRAGNPLLLIGWC